MTGASSGIGSAFARLLADDGFDVVLVGRDADRLEALMVTLPGTPRVLVADLAQESGIVKIETFLQAEMSDVDLLVNNAAATWFGPFVEHDPDRLTRTVGLNVTAVIRLSRCVLPFMLARRTGGVINMSSLAAAAVKPNLATYAATKAFIDSWTASMQEELSGSGVLMTSVRPGWVRTEFYERSGRSMDQVKDSDWLAPQTVARRALKAHEQKKALVTILPSVGRGQWLRREVRRSAARWAPWLRDANESLTARWRNGRP